MMLQKTDIAQTIQNVSIKPAATHYPVYGQVQGNLINHRDHLISASTHFFLSFFFFYGTWALLHYVSTNGV